MLKKIITVISGIALLCVPAFAQTFEARDIVIHFHQGRADIDYDYMENRATFDGFVKRVNAVLADEQAILEYVTIETAASPEGDPALNDRLAVKRARSIHDYLLTVLPIESPQVKIYSRGVDWPGLVNLLKDSDVKWKEDIFRAIRETGVLSVNGHGDQRECLKRLKAIDKGNAWRYLMDGPFAELRAGSARLGFAVRRTLPERDTVIVVHEYLGPDADWYLGEASRMATEEATANVLKALEKKPKKTRWSEQWREPAVAFRSNLLLPLLNAGIEIPINNRWSLETDVYWPWVWRNWMNQIVEPQSQCLELLAFNVAPRYWFGVAHSPKSEYYNRRLTGHSVALVLQGGYFDFCRNREGQQGEWFGAGLDYMYALPLREGNVRLEFEFALGLGYFFWRGYGVHEVDGPLMGDYRDGQKLVPMPMKLGVNLMVPIYRKRNK